MVVAGFRIERVLGNGGTGTVYLALSPAEPHRVALKVLNRDLSDNLAFRWRFIKAVQLAAALSHPNIVPVLDHGETDDDLLWITMRYIDGSDADRQLRAGRMPPERAVRIVSEVARALDYAHSRRITHGDIKPPNFLVEHDTQQVVLADFGLAGSFDDNGRLGGSEWVLASAAYASPEALRGGPMNGSADIYALGCSLFRLLTGKPPFFDAGSKSETVQYHLHCAPPRVTQFAPWLPAAMDDVIVTAMAKDPAARYPSAGALARAAERALTAQSAAKESRGSAFRHRRR